MNINLITEQEKALAELSAIIDVWDSQPLIGQMAREQVCEECFQALKRRNGRVCAVANLYTHDGKPCFGFCKGIEQ